MRPPVIQVLGLYGRNKGFTLILSAVVLSGLVSRIAYALRRYSMAEDFFTLLFVFSLWLAFHFGILIKRQFATYNCGILPGYRRAHVVGMLVVYALVIGLEMLWARGVRLDFPWMPASSMTGVWGTGLLTSLFIILLGYFSMGRVLLYGYCLLLVGSAYLARISDVYQVNADFVYAPFTLWGIGLVAFILRLNSLREESFEYRHLLTWPPKNAVTARGFVPRRKPRPAEAAPLRPYHALKNLPARVRHWDLALGDEPGLLKSVGSVVAGIYLLVFLKVPWTMNWLKAIENNFLLFVLTPLVMVVIRQYKGMIFWGYDILRPLPKGQYVREQMAGLLARALGYWALTVLVLGIVPARLFYSPAFLSARLAGYFFLSGSLLFLVLAVLVVLMTVQRLAPLLVHGGLLTVTVLLLFDTAATYTVSGYVLVGWACLAGGLIYIKKGYHAWCRKEVV